MTAITHPIEPTATPAGDVSTRVTVLLAFACGLIVANLYYAQPLAGPIGAALGLSADATGLIVTLTQIGYGAGLLFIVPLGDLIETRRLVLTLIGLATLALLGAALATHPAPFFVAVLGVGLASVAAQVLVPYAAHLAPEAMRGRVVGNVMSGLMLGIMLARPVASFVAELASWHAVFYLSAAAMAVLAALIGFALPRRVPTATLGYGQLLASMIRLMRDTPVLRRRAFYQSCQFAAFSLFWTTVPLLLAGPEFKLSQAGIALFALAGVAGAFASPIAGRMADRGWTRAATACALASVGIAFGISHLGSPGSPVALGFLVAAGILLDFGVTTSLVLGQRAIFVLGAEYRSRLNGLYMATFFLGGALGSALGAFAFARGDWLAASALGMALPVIGLVYFATE